MTEDEIKDGFRHAMRRLATTLSLDHKSRRQLCSV